MRNNDLSIEVFNDSSFLLGSDSPTTYEKVYQYDHDAHYVPSSKHAVIVYQKDKLISSAILLGHAGATGIHGDGAFILEESLIVRCSNIVFSLSLPRLDLNWMVKADTVTCFSIYEYQNTIITHGEVSVSRINKNGETQWEFGGRDIFIRLDARSSFTLQNDHIKLLDFIGYDYRIDYNGKLLEHAKSEFYEEPQYVRFPSKQNKPWWKFWWM